MGCGKGYKTMKTSHLSVLALFLFICLTAESHAGMTSWVGKDGVRHYSNTNAPADNATVRNIEELKHREEKSNVKQKDNKRDGFGVLQMYEEDRKIDKEEKELLELQRKNKELDRAIEASRRAKRKKQEQNCRVEKDTYDTLRSLGWRNYPASQQELRDLQDKIINDSRGTVKRRDLGGGQEKIRKELYERALERQEKEVQEACTRKGD
jgi:hypothetical protein